MDTRSANLAVAQLAHKWFASAQPAERGPNDFAQLASEIVRSMQRKELSREAATRILRTLLAYEIERTIVQQTTQQIAADFFTFSRRLDGANRDE